MTNADLIFCPRCAARLEWRAVEYPGVLHPVCTACEFVLWQNTKATVEALIVRGEGARAEVLLGRRIADLPRVTWDAPGGFLNAGDKIEAVLIRECKREMGIDVKVGDLVGAYEGMFFDIPIVSLIYACQIVGGNPTPHDYIDEVRWFPLSDPPELAFAMIGEAISAVRRKLQA